MLSLPWEKQRKKPGAASGRHRLTGKPVAGDAFAATSDTSTLVTGVIGASGGCGATTLAVNLASAMASRHGAAILLDANLQQPDSGTLLAVRPAYSLADLLSKGALSDGELLNACSTEFKQKEGRLRLLMAPEEGDTGVRHNVGEVAALVDAARGQFSRWVVDLPRHLDKHLVVLLDRLDFTVVVFEPTLTGIAGLRRWERIMNELGYSRGRRLHVMNRAGARLDLIESQLEEQLAVPADAKVPNAFKVLQECCASGEPLVERSPRHPYTRAVRQLCDAIDRSTQLQEV